MFFSEKLMDLRRRAGLSQEQLADRLNVTRQSVSKWESGTAMPEIAKLIALSDLFGVSIDVLVKDELEISGSVEPETNRLEQRLDELTEAYHDSFGAYYSYTSEATLFGIPLVSIRLGRAQGMTKQNTAIGVIAIGNFSIGVVSIGIVSLGIISAGVVALGALALGVTSVGWVAAGISAVGCVFAKGVAAVTL